MSILIEKEIPCRSCKYPNKAEVWNVLNVQEDPELKDILLGGELNMVECESCKNVFYAEHFLIYHDPGSQIMAFVYPYSYKEQKAQWEQKTQDDFRQSQDISSDEQKIPYFPVSMFGLDELVWYVEKDEDMKVQCEIADHLSKEKGWGVKKISPYLARKQSLPLVLPYIKDSKLPFHQSLAKAIDQLINLNDRLTVYLEMKKKLAENSSLEIKLT